MVYIQQQSHFCKFDTTEWSLFNEYEKQVFKVTKELLLIDGPYEDRLSIPQIRLFDDTFGAYFGSAVGLWWCLKKHCNLHPKFEIKHMLWALCHMKLYMTDSITADRFRVSRSTFKKWVMIALDYMSLLDKVLVS